MTSPDYYHTIFCCSSLFFYFWLSLSIYTSDPSWGLDKVSLIKLVNGTLTETDEEGLLFVTLVGRQSQIKINGTVCNLNWHSAQLICQSLGFMFADWKNSPGNLRYDIK